MYFFVRVSKQRTTAYKVSIQVSEGSKVGPLKKAASIVVTDLKNFNPRQCRKSDDHTINEKRFEVRNDFH